MDGEGDPAAETVAQRVLAVAGDEPYLHQEVGTEGTRQASKQEVGIAGRVADAELLHAVRGDAARGEVRAGLCGLRSLEQHAVVQRPGFGVRAVQRLPAAGRLAVAGTLALVPEPDPGLLGKAFHGLGEREVLDPFDE